MIKLVISFFTILLISSCEINNSNTGTNIVNNNKENIKNVIFDYKQRSNSKEKIKKKLINIIFLKYVVGEIYFIDGVKYIPEENYSYNEIGLATFYGKELHNIKTINNDKNKVTELLGRHKTLPLPSIVKVTNLENGFSVIVKINDRLNDNSSVIQVSRKTAQLLKFYKNKIAKVKVEILSDPSKQMKIVTESMSKSNFNDTIASAPTEKVIISNIDNDNNPNKLDLNIEQPIEIGFENINNKNLFLQIYEFKSYQNAKSVISDLKISHKFIIQNEGNTYSIKFGPLENEEANNLVLSFISKGYKKTEFILE